MDKLTQQIITIPLESLQRGKLTQQVDGLLQFSYQTAVGTETRFFVSESQLKAYLHNVTKASIWKMDDCRTGNQYYYYFAWGRF